MTTRPSLVALGTLLLAGVAAADTTTTTVDFESGTEGWTGPQGPGGGTVVEATGGNPGAHLHTVFNNFGIEFRNQTNPAFVFDWTTVDSVTIGVDLEVENIAFFGTPVTRSWIVEIRDFDDADPYPWVSVWFKYDEVGAGDWQSFSVTIDDTSATELPPGWGGYGAEDPDTFEPILPPDRTFADVLAGADEIVFTTYEPGFFYGFTDFDVRLDNITITTETTSAPVTGDLDGDGLVAFSDLLILLSAWGPCTDCPADLDGDGAVGFSDVLILLSAWS